MTAEAESRYRQLMGDAPFDRQDAALAARCPRCWAPPGLPHSPLCPDHVEQEQAGPADDQEPLF